MSNLLVITSKYPDLNNQISSQFVKDQVKYLSKYFTKVFVISPIPYLPKISQYFLSSESFGHSLRKDYLYDNVEVIYVKNLYLPFGINYKKRGEQAYRKIKDVILKREIVFDIVHSHFSWPFGYAAANISKDFGCKSFLTIHENREWLLKEEQEKYVQETWQNLDGIIRVNKIDLSLLKKYNENVVSIANGYDHNKFASFKAHEKNTERGIDKNLLEFIKGKKILFTLSGLIKRKGIHDLLQAINILNNKRDDFVLLVGGSGPEKANLLRIIEKNKINNCKLLGFLSDDEVLYWMQKCDLFVIPSYSEGNPTTMFEALGSGKPVVSTRVGGVPEILNDDCGILVDNDADDISKKINDALDNNWNNDKIKQYSKNYTWENIAKKIWEFYNI